MTHFVNTQVIVNPSSLLSYYTNVFAWLFIIFILFSTGFSIVK